MRKNKKPLIFRTFINSFHYLYQDAELFRDMAKSNSYKDRFERVQLSRTAILLYVLSLEALINRVIDNILPEKLREFFVEREDRFSLEDKFLLLPLLLSEKATKHFDKSRYPWSHFKELVRLRNEYVHPKHDRAAYYEAITQKTIIPLQWNEIPKDLEIKEKELVFRNTKIPKDPYSILPEHLDTAKKVVDDIVKKLDELLDGKILKDNWYKNESWELIYPPGAKLSDIPSDDT